MRIIVTGAGGFVGQRVVQQLKGHDIVALDADLTALSSAPNITKLRGDLRNADVIERAFSGGCDAVIHLATVPGGAAEADSALAKSVNIDATMALIGMAAKIGNCPRFVFASSIAVFGKLPVAPVVDGVPPRPIMYYGAHKLMMENWISCQSRRGVIDGISLRLPGIVARPKSSSGMKSAFLSDLFHAIRSGEDFTMPVTKEAYSWLCSVLTASKNIALAATVKTPEVLDDRTVLMPILRVNMLALEHEIKEQIGGSSSTISYLPDAALQSIFAEHPPVSTPFAEKVGFFKDSDLKTLVDTVLFENRPDNTETTRSLKT